MWLYAGDGKSVALCVQVADARGFSAAILTGKGSTFVALIACTLAICEGPRWGL